jgi:hypothetical protein
MAQDESNDEEFFNDEAYDESMDSDYQFSTKGILSEENINQQDLSDSRKRLVADQLNKKKDDLSFLKNMGEQSIGNLSTLTAITVVTFVFGCGLDPSGGDLLQTNPDTLINKLVMEGKIPHLISLVSAFIGSLIYLAVDASLVKDHKEEQYELEIQQRILGNLEKTTEEFKKEAEEQKKAEEERKEDKAFGIQSPEPLRKMAGADHKANGQSEDQPLSKTEPSSDPTLNRQAGSFKLQFKNLQLINISVLKKISAIDVLIRAFSYAAIISFTEMISLPLIPRTKDKNQQIEEYREEFAKNSAFKPDSCSNRAGSVFTSPSFLNPISLLSALTSRIAFLFFELGQAQEDSSPDTSIDFDVFAGSKMATQKGMSDLKKMATSKERLLEVGMSQIILQSELKDLFYRWFIFPTERFVLFLVFALINLMSREYFRTINNKISNRMNSYLYTCQELGDPECKSLCLARSCEKNSINGIYQKKRKTLPVNNEENNENETNLNIVRPDR